MAEIEDFDWIEFYELANECYNCSTEARLRTGINRYYFSSFCTSREFLVKNKIFLDEKSEKIIKSKSPKAHYETRKTFKKHPYFKKSKVGHEVGKNLEYLRKKRNNADYNNSNYALEPTFKYCKSKTERIFELLNKLN